VSYLAVVAAKHSPGGTTASLAFTAAASGAVPALLVEADPAGGDIAARVGLPVTPGLVSLAAAGRWRTSSVDLDAHLQPLPAGGTVIVGSTSPDQAAAALGTIADRLAPTLAAANRPIIVDAGRWWPASPAAPLVGAARYVLVVLQPTVEGVEHVRTRLDSLRATAADGLRLVLVGDRPYSCADVEAALGVAVLGALAADRRGAGCVIGRSRAGAARRTALVRSARSLLDRLLADAPSSKEVAS
jgi:hypothetical protein